MKSKQAAQQENSKQMSLLAVDTRDPDQVMTDLVKQRDLIDRCLLLGEDIIMLINKDADQLLNDVRTSEPLGIEEMRKAMGKRNGHMSAEFHKDFSSIFGKIIREKNEQALIFLRDALLAMNDVTLGNVTINAVNYVVNPSAGPTG